MNWLGRVKDQVHLLPRKCHMQSLRSTNKMVIESISVGLGPANPLCKLITAWTKWSPEGALVVQDGA